MTRTATLKIRWREDELSTLRLAAQANGVTLSEYIRRAAMAAAERGER